MRATMIVALALMLVGCGHLPFGHRAPQRGGETITYSYYTTAPCARGITSCPHYTITLGPDGQGIVSDRWHGSESRFQAAPQQVEAFARRLEPYRPKDEIIIGPPLCEMETTDADTIEVRWNAADGSNAHLKVYTGCDSDKNHKLIDAVSSAPNLLPLPATLSQP